MIIKYKVSCKCGFKARVTYGRVGKRKVHEVFSCPKCRNLFTLEFNKPLKCKKCRNSSLIPYNPNKEDNLAFYKKMIRSKMLIKSKLKELENFWKNIKDKECPLCGKKQLKWTASVK